MHKNRRRQNRELSAEQEQVINLLLEGRTECETAEAVGISRRSLDTWKDEDSVFVAELNRRRIETWTAQNQRLRSLIRRAVDVLGEDLGSEDRKLRQSAAVHLLRTVGLYGVDQKPLGPTTPDAVEQIWEADEQYETVVRAYSLRTRAINRDVFGPLLDGSGASR